MKTNIQKMTIRLFVLALLIMLFSSSMKIYAQGGGGPIPTTATTGIVSPLSYCAGDSIWVPYTDSGTFGVNNVFTIELSDANGDFSFPTIIGSLATQLSGVIPCLIPWNTPTGLYYRVRVMGSEPFTQGTENAQDIEIRAKPAVSFTGTFPNQCEHLTNLDLSTYAVVSPAGGTFSGPGVSGANFSAFAAGSQGSPHTITYTYSDGIGCANYATNSIVVLPFPVVSFSNLAPYYCTNFHSDFLNGTPTGGTFSGPGMTGNLFNPSTAGAGTHTISYTYSAANGCSNTYSQTVVVDNCIGIDSEEQNHLPGITVYPNPNDGIFVIEIPGNGKTDVEIYSVQGALINKFSAVKGEKIMTDISFVSSGLYYLRVDEQIVKINVKKY